jgi:hypothetical protein
VTPDFIRLSISIEDIDDILWDLDQTLNQSWPGKMGISCEPKMTLATPGSFRKSKSPD